MIRLFLIFLEVLEANADEKQESVGFVFFSLKTVKEKEIKMPNDCWNYVTLVCDDSNDLNNLVANELVRAPGLDYSDNMMYYKNITIDKKCARGVQFRQLTAWKPDFVWLQSVVAKYPNCWLKNEWCEEGGTAGVWVGSIKNGVQSMQWEDLSLEAKENIFNS